MRNRRLALLLGAMLANTAILPMPAVEVFAAETVTEQDMNTGAEPGAAGAGQEQGGQDASAQAPDQAAADQAAADQAAAEQAAQEAAQAAAEQAAREAAQAAADQAAAQQAEQAAQQTEPQQSAPASTEPETAAQPAVSQPQASPSDMPETVDTEDAVNVYVTEEEEVGSEAVDSQLAAEGRKSEEEKETENLVDKDGLIVDNDDVTTNSIAGDPEVSLEELWDDQMHNRQFPGFEVDPTRYPAANITVNTVVLYRFLTKDMLLNHAAACGVLANIQLESNFRPLALGDSGTSYGICQWHNGRFTNLMNFCKQRDLDYNTLEGQMQYLQWDLTHGYKGVYEKLLKVEDTEDGAYQAGYLFCYHFEIPDQVEARSVRRGNLARTEYYEKDFEQLEWELKHSAMLLGVDWLKLKPEQLPETWNQGGGSGSAAARDAGAAGENAADGAGGNAGTDAETQTAQEQPETQAQALPEWHSTLGEPAALL